MRDFHGLGKQHRQIKQLIQNSSAEILGELYMKTEKVGREY